ncbi:hypothetical protein NIES2109_61980 (plasmid) [Nostoc sp. HK-01]|nr:hypothetical protein NIES2109_61980 [Nostoc sp. HK-01]
MLAKNQSPQDFSPFAVPQMEQTKQEQKPDLAPQKPSENNKTRVFRRAGNICEIVAGTCLNSTIVFTFHLMQVHPIGLLLAVGTAHLYFTATAIGEGTDKAATNIMTGLSASFAIFCSLSEPVSEWWEARQSKTIAQTQIQQMYHPATSDGINWMQVGQWGAIAFGAIILLSILRSK